MPKHLRIVVGLMILGILLRIVFWGFFLSHTTQSPRWVGDLIAILITIGLIKGFMSRSLIAWHLAKVLNILGLIVVCIMLVFCLLASNTPGWFWAWALAGIACEIYCLWVLFSSEIRRYFTGERIVQPDAPQYFPNRDDLKKQ